MKHDDDDVDELVRAAMKVLDEGVPPGYFEGLPNRTLARLEENSMQTTSGSSGTDLPSSTGVPPADRNEDSGLHDIRNLATSARMRISSRRISTSPPVDEDILAATSGSWKAVALPEPAKMVSLPDLADLPSKEEIKKAEKASRRSRPSGSIAPVAAAGSSVTALPAAPAVEAPLHLDDVPSVAGKPATVTSIGSHIARPKKNRGALIGMIGLGLAAAAGVTVFVTTQGSKDQQAAEATAPAPEKTEGARVAAPAPTVQPIEEPKPAGAAAAADTTAAPDPAPVDNNAADPTPPAKLTGKGKRLEKPETDGKPGKKQVIEVPGPVKTDKPTKVEPATPVKEEKKDGEPDFDQLLKEAGVDQTKAEKKPKLERTSLSAGDFKSGMAAVEGKAKACYNGTQGTATVRITIAPSGSVSKVVVGGAFAGTPVASCIEGAVKSASFPPWDGGPQSMGYSYLLSE